MEYTRRISSISLLSPSTMSSLQPLLYHRQLECSLDRRSSRNTNCRINLEKERLESFGEVSRWWIRKGRERRILDRQRGWEKRSQREKRLQRRRNLFWFSR